jgi:hypothetical protein
LQIFKIIVVVDKVRTKIYFLQFFKKRLLTKH